MPQRLLFLDAETYYDDQYSLKKMLPPNYILDPRFELIGCAAKEGTGPSRWIDGPDFPEFLRGYDPRETTTVTFNALFDNCIFAWRYGFIPRRILCAMRMSVALRGDVLSGASLATVARSLGLGEKGNTIASVKGMHRSDIMVNPGLWRAYQAYACLDCDLAAGIFFQLYNEFPLCEQRVMDLVLRCAIEPRFQVDVQLLQDHLKDLDAERLEMLALAGCNTQSEATIEDFCRTLRSNVKFEQLLKQHGIDVEYKQSASDPTLNIPAFAKTDDFMGSLLEHEDPLVQALATARLGVRSTIEHTRGERFLSIAALPWGEYYHGGNMPIPLRYQGAHTGRLSGEWNVNPQNMPSGRGQKKSKLRKSLRAPEGHKVVVTDSAQIECRVNAFVCGQDDLLEMFRRGEDPYSNLATDVFGYVVTKESAKTIHTIERFIGKGGELGLGFGCGADKFYNMVVRQGRGLGMNMPTLMQMWSPQLAQRTVDVYRTRRSKIKAAWGQLETILETAWCGLSAPVRWGPVEIGPGYVLLPNGMKMRYKVTSTTPGDLRYVYQGRQHRMYGPKFLENIVQALARIIVMNAALRLEGRGYRFKLQSHDELAFIVPDADVENAKKIILEEMVRPPSWGLRIPLGAEVGVGQSYGDAK